MDPKSITCSCGAIIKKSSQYAHLRSIKHNRDKDRIKIKQQNISVAFD